MAIELFQDVILTADMPAERLCAGDIGTVVERHVTPGIEDGFSVEFFDLTGRTVAVTILPGSMLRAPTPSDRPSVRVLAKTA